MKSIVSNNGGDETASGPLKDGRSRLFFHFLAVAIPKLLNSVGMLAANVFLMRYMSAEQFGVLGVCTGILLIVDSVIGSAVDMGVVKLVPACQDTDPERAAAIQSTALYLKVGLGLLTVLSILPFGQQVSSVLFHSPVFSGALNIALAASIAILALRSVQASLQVRGQFGAYGRLDIWNNVVKYGGISILALTNTVSLERVLLLYLAGPLVAFLAGLRGAAAGIFNPRRLTWSLTREFTAAVGWFLLTFGSAALAGRADLFVLSARANIYEAGLFAAANLVPLGTQLLGSYVSVLLSPRISPLLNDRKFFTFFQRTQKWVLLGSFLFLTLGFIAAVWLGPLVLPVAFRKSAEIALVMMPGAAAGLATFPLTLSFVMFYRPRFLFTLDCYSVPLLLLLLWFLIPPFGAIGAAAVSSGANLVRAAVVQALAWRWARESEEIGPADFTPVPALSS